MSVQGPYRCAEGKVQILIFTKSRAQVPETDAETHEEYKNARIGMHGHDAERGDNFQELTPSMTSSQSDLREG